MRKRSRHLRKMAILAVSALMILGCSKDNDSWREEIRLSNGDLIVADMENFYGNGGIGFSHGPLLKTRMAWKYKGRDYFWEEEAVAPRALQVDEQGRFYVVATIEYRWACAVRRNPKSYYLAFRYDGSAWHEVPLGEISLSTVFNLAGSNQSQHSTKRKRLVRENDWKYKDDNRPASRQIVPDKKSSCTGVVSAPLKGVWAKPEGSPSVQLVNEPCPRSAVVRVALSEDNTITLNGAKVSLEALNTNLQQLGPDIREVCYHRANPESPEPPPAGMSVLTAITKTSLPISIYWDAEFQRRAVYGDGG